MSEIDEGLYSRQLYVLGKHAMQKLPGGSVLICGLGGLGLEIAKNLALAGVGQIVLYDLKDITWKDLSSHFYAQETDIGRNRAQVSKQKLSELNLYVNITVLEQELSDDFIRSLTALVLTDSCREDCKKMDEMCRTYGVSLVVANTKGIFGQLFCDFGDTFIIEDEYADDPNQFEVLNVVKKDGTLEVNLTDDTKGSFSEGDYVSFHRVQEFEEINDFQEPMKIIYQCGRYFAVEIPSSLLGTLSGDSYYGHHGFVKEVRQPRKLQFKSYEESVASPSYVINDYPKIKDHLWIHKAFLTLDDYFKKHGRLPRPKSEEDAREFLGMYNNTRLSEEPEITDEGELEKLLRKFAMTCDGDFCPIQSIVGGLAAQEVVKAITKKFRPLHQWFQCDARELLTEEWEKLTENDCKPLGNRYDGSRSIFGSEIQTRLADCKLFTIGMGAIGCEMLKNWAMLGIGTGNGKVTITDMDMIEKSNLNRQFLFRSEHIGKMKSTIAADVIKQMMNKDMKIESHVNKVGMETENVYNDDFFQSQDVIINALDNVQAREYVNGRCIYYEKPLIDSGTMGLQCSTQVILPHLTVTYKSSSGQDEKAIPMCTLKFFPLNIEHTIQWARDDFEGRFCMSIKAAEDYIRDEQFWSNLNLLTPYQKLEKLKDISTVFNEVLNKCYEPKLENLVRWARISFDRNFDHQIRQLVSNFPPDHVTSKGLRFWHGSKKCPSAITFDASNTLHMGYIISTINLYAQVFNLPLITEGSGVNLVREIIASLQLPDFQVDKDMKIPEDDDELKSQIGETKLDDNELQELRNQLPKREELMNLKMNALQFEKDSSDNFHMEYITAASNMRATNYKIPIFDQLQTKKIVGKIIPAVATTTSFVVGLVCIELIKVLIGNWELESFKNTFSNLSCCSFSTTKPKISGVFKYNGDVNFTAWSRFDIDHDITIGDLINYFKENHQLDIDLIEYSVESDNGEHKKSLVFSHIVTKNIEDRKKMKVTQAIEEVTGVPLKPHTSSLLLNVYGVDHNGKDVEKLPFVKIKVI